MKAPMQTAATASQNALGRRLMASGRLGSTTSRCHPSGLSSSSGVHTIDCDDARSRKIIDISCDIYKIIHMDSRRLQHFVAVVDHGGFTAAAKATFVSQPALSFAVKELEADLGIALFDRIGRKVQLTAAGAALLGPARQVLRDLETGRSAVTAVSGLESGVLSLACLPTLAADPTAALVGRFRSHHPGVRVDLAAPEDTRELFELVETGTCELGLTDALDVPDTLVSTGLGSQVLVFILPPGTPSTSPRRRR